MTHSVWFFDTQHPLTGIPEHLWDTPIHNLMSGVSGECAALTPRQAAAAFEEFHCPGCVALLRNLSHDHHKEAS